VRKTRFVGRGDIWSISLGGIPVSGVKTIQKDWLITSERLKLAAEKSPRINSKEIQEWRGRKFQGDGLLPRGSLGEKKISKKIKQKNSFLKKLYLIRPREKGNCLIEAKYSGVGKKGGLGISQKRNKRFLLRGEREKGGEGRSFQRKKEALDHWGRGRERQLPRTKAGRLLV